jgi:hypothetical protein
MSATAGGGQSGWLRPAGEPGAGSPQVPGVVMLRLLGAGGHGEVWLAEDLVSGDQVAVKVRRDPAVRLPSPRSDGVGEGSRDEGDEAVEAAQGAARLNREVALLRRIDHPHVVRLRRVVDLPGGARALVMDHAAGGSLADLVGLRGPLDAAEGATLSVPLARTLADLHERGLVHGDLTPSNVLFTADGRPMIADLGCAVVLGDATAEAWGSPGYCDPARVGRAGPPDDVYSLGAVLRFALTGRPGPDDGPPGGPDDGPPGGPDDGPPGRPGDLPGAVAGAEPGALLALADLCTAPEAARRPGPRAVAATVLATVTPAPIRLIGVLPPPDRAARSPITPIAAAPGRGPGRAAPVRIRFAAATPTVSTPTVSTPTAPTSLPITMTDLPAPAGVTRTVNARSVPTGRVAAAQTGRVAAAPRERAVGTQTGSGRRRREPEGRAPRPRRTGRSGGVPNRLWWAVAVSCGLAVAVVTGRWLGVAGAADAGTGGSGGAGGAGAGGTAARPAAAVAAPADSDASGWPLAASVAVNATVAHLAEARAAAFRQASIEPLAAVDEPGSPALTADLAFVRRLQAAGVRLTGLTFTVAAIQVGARSADGSLPVTARVITSAHVQEPVVGSTGGVAGRVPQSSPREVTLILVPARDGRGWLVRSVR